MEKTAKRTPTQLGHPQNLSPGLATDVPDVIPRIKRTCIRSFFFFSAHSFITIAKRLLVFK
jgi:hypothetical protein